MYLCIRLYGILEKGTKKYMKKFFGVAIGSIFIYFILSICRLNLATLNNLFVNNMMQLFFIAIFAYVLFLVSYINIKVELERFIL